MAPTAVTDVPAGDAAERRVLAAAGRCVARWGVAKTTLDDVAREAGCSRATVYRAVPGGKDALVAAYVRAELDRFFATVARRLDAATDLEDLLAGGLSEAARLLAGHEPLQYLLANEPEVVLPAVAFGRMDRVFARAAEFAAPWLRPWLGDRAGEAAEWLCRLACSYLLSPAPGIDLTDEDDARRLVRDFVLPGLRPVPALDLTDDRS
ncbi:MAG TPA: TetR/AcrR family transcriptional regulator [Acidimicrobiales bacterium]|jgi:AcrR family transcriptional regulator